MAGKQRGNTLLGLVIGGLAGLGIALAVAVYITKMPVPFTNTTPPRQADSDEAEIRKNKDWNPNAPLAGKNPARATPAVSGELADQAPDVAEPTSTSVPDPVRMPQPVAKAVPKPAAGVAATPAISAEPAVSAKASSTDPLGELAKAAVSKPAVAVAPPASKVRVNDPLGDLAESVTAPAKAPSPAALAHARPAELMPAGSVSDPFKYFVQAGAFRTEEEAARQLSRLQSLGLQARVTEREQAGRTVYRVRLGPFERKDDADTLTGRLSGHSIDTALVRVQR